MQHTAENSNGKPVIGRPFMTGDQRINRRGRPRNFDAFRELAQSIAHETTTDKNGNVITIAERILRSWAESKEPMLQRSFIEYCYGKPPDKIEAPGLEPGTQLVLYYAHEFDKKFGDSAAKELAGPCCLTPTRADRSLARYIQKDPLSE